MQSTIFILLFTASAVLCDSLPELALAQLRNAGINRLNSEIGSVNTELTNAVNAFKSVNSSCSGVVQNQLQQCIGCVNSKCEQRAKSACGPNGWEKALAKGVNAVKSASDVILKKVPNVVMAAPDKLVDIAKDVHGFLKDKVVNTVVDAGKKVVDKVKDVGNSIGKEVGRVWSRVWGKRSLRGTHALKFRRNAEPSCGELENNPDQACRTYLQTNFCPSCGFDPMTGCNGYKAAVDRVRNAEAARAWLDKATNKEYDIQSVTFGGGFTNVQATVQLFGKQLVLNMGNMNPYDVNNAGPAIAAKALDLFKQM